MRQQGSESAERIYERFVIPALEAGRRQEIRNPIQVRLGAVLRATVAHETLRNPGFRHTLRP
jgi:hypothetical protein